MKTTKIYTALSLALIFAAATSVFSAKIGKTTQISGNPGIRYQVNIHLTGEINVCNTYLVEIRDGKGQLVAPAKHYISGVSRYEFSERGPGSGVRIAALVVSNIGDRFVCDKELFTTPVPMAGPFLNYQIYRFDLFPKAQGSRE